LVGDPDEGEDRFILLGSSAAQRVLLVCQTLACFKTLAEETEIPYQTLIHSFLRECAVARKKPSMKWKKAG
jgi:hypothetical protein